MSLYMINDDLLKIDGETATLSEEAKQQKKEMIEILSQYEEQIEEASERMKNFISRIKDELTEYKSTTGTIAKLSDDDIVSNYYKPKSAETLDEKALQKAGLSLTDVFTKAGLDPKEFIKEKTSGDYFTCFRRSK